MAVVVALAAGCGGGGGHAQASTTTEAPVLGPATTAVAQGGPGSGSGPPGPDLARAQGIVLVASDLGPDFTSSAHDTTSGTRALTDCGLGNSVLVDPTYPTQADSDDYERVLAAQTVDVSSEARVTPDVGSAQQAAAIVAQARFRSCAADSLRAEVSSAGVVESVKATPLPVTAPVQDAVGIRAAVRVKADQVEEDITVDLVFLRKDRALAYVSVTTTVGTPDDGLRDRLVAAMASRM